MDVASLVSSASKMLIYLSLYIDELEQMVKKFVKQKALKKLPLWM